MYEAKRGAATFNPVRRAVLRGIVAIGMALPVASLAISASAQSLLEKIKNGDVIRIGFSGEKPWAYPGENQEPLGFVNAMTIDILKRLGATKIEPVVTEWGSLIPGLQAGRFDIITGGMYITPERCRNVLFTEPLGIFSDALLVLKGNPHALHSYEDIRDKGVTLTIAAGSVYVKTAKRVGIPEDKVMLLDGDVASLQALKAGRTAAIGGAYFTLKAFVDKDSSLELAEPFTPPEASAYPALALLPDRQGDVDAINAVLKEYVSSPEMMASVEKYGYTKTNLPDGTKTSDLCKR
ncbi:ectoine/hydroxyectoine ABC transporter substrate-binding protein EhuB [Ensifer sp. NBAIM29]|nr:ectoine/hydroxyectoine ABC transporter substrate-binding protein EhuB [Ensifer sp. NBAIM29]